MLICLALVTNSFSADTYDATKNSLSIPLLKFNNTYYSDVKITVKSVVGIGSKDSSSPNYDVYNASNNQLQIASVIVGAATYYNVVVTVGDVLGFRTSCAQIVSCGVNVSGLASEYSTALSIGDSGTLTIDTLSNPITYTLKVTESSYGLRGKIITGKLTDNGDDTYNVVGSNYAKVFKYDCYAIVPIKVYSENVGADIYISAVALKKECLLTTVDQITSNGTVMSFRDIYFGFKKVNASKQYSAYAANGTITKISNTSFSVASCSNLDSSKNNSGNSANNGYLKNCTVANPTYSKKTYTYDSTLGGWVVEQTSGSTIKVIANFVPDTLPGQILGYIDTSDSSGNSAGFDIVSISNEPNNGGDTTGTATFISYQLCSDSGNCANAPNGESGLYVEKNVPLSSSNKEVYTDSSGCVVTNTADDPIIGFYSNVHTGTNGSCGQAGNKPDNINFVFGQSNKGGKLRALLAAAGYDVTLSKPSNKFSLGTLMLD